VQFVQSRGAKCSKTTVSRPVSITKDTEMVTAHYCTPLLTNNRKFPRSTLQSIVHARGRVLIVPS